MAFNEVSIEYKADPNIENYVRLRRKHPGKMIDIAIGGGIEWLFGNQKMLEQFDINPELVAGALDADLDDISEQSLIQMERLIERKKEEKSGKRI